MLDGSKTNHCCKFMRDAIQKSMKTFHDGDDFIKTCFFVLFAASIDCNIDECRKPMKIYEELGCKPIYGSKSCCPKRFECPDNMKVVKDENKCTFEGIDYKIGEVLPRNLTTESKCVEACICSRSLLTYFNSFNNYLINLENLTDMKRSQPSFYVRIVIVAFPVLKCRAV